jgi:alkanesulfonate monooxygenase SsuD/methylene tetrahydromethanopterin reductase-like flavin-dependent oxidoreductase (luciferase family)
MDYGHDIELGAFITPSSSSPERVLELVQTAERSGIGLVTFQDHPYQADFLDTWTLLSFVAAQTSTVHLSGNVLNLPLRSPAVLARAAASLDLLSGGRFELALGAGAFWDAIVAMGGERRTPAESVEALSEAIDVVRGVWDVDVRERLVLHGEHYHLDGARRGPRPAHPIAIWIGGLKPRMLRLVGEKADGWLPTLEFIGGTTALRDANAMIDDAATAKGRPPAAIRRLLNFRGEASTVDGDALGPSHRWGDHLADLVFEHGFSTFILASDDPMALARFGNEVGPELREIVAKGRSAPR